MSQAAAAAGLSPDLDVSLVERYTDGAEMSDGLVQGIRFDIRGGKPFFRIGAGRNERADVIVEITSAAARELNGLRSGDPEYPVARDLLITTGEMRITGDPSHLGDWLEAVHDPIVNRTI